MLPQLLSVGNKFWAEEKQCWHCCQSVLQNSGFLEQMPRRLLFWHKCCCKLPEKFYLRGSQMASLLQSSWHAVVCRTTAVHFTDGGIPTWQCGSMCLLFIVKGGISRAGGVYRGRLHNPNPPKASVNRPCKSKPNERGVKPLRILSGETLPRWRR